jgi:hypothetical protein
LVARAAGTGNLKRIDMEKELLDLSALDRLGINLVVFALTQEGSIAQQQVDFYKHAVN